MIPIFNSPNVPSAIKPLAVIAISAMLFPVVRQSIKPMPLELAAFASVIIGELIYGIIIALSLAAVFSAFEVAGELIGFQMGFGFAQTADPLTGSRFAVLAIWAQLLATMVFLSVNGHHVILKTLVESFKLVPIGSFTVDQALCAKMLTICGTIFILAVKLAAPVIAVLILSQLGFGLIAKFAPQINILATSFPATITLGMLFLGFTLIFWGDLEIESFTRLFHFLANLAR
jgi:flagellar biosynthetic protein FliR